jgi:hypothetical protein
LRQSSRWPDAGTGDYRYGRVRAVTGGRGPAPQSAKRSGVRGRGNGTERRVFSKVSRSPLSLVRTRWSDGRRVASAMATGAGARARARRVWSRIDGELPKDAGLLLDEGGGLRSLPERKLPSRGRAAEAARPSPAYEDASRTSLIRSTEPILLLDLSVAPRDESGPRSRADQKAGLAKAVLESRLRPRRPSAGRPSSFLDQPWVTRRGTKEVPSGRQVNRQPHFPACFASERLSVAAASAAARESASPSACRKCL